MPVEKPSQVEQQPKISPSREALRSEFRNHLAFIEAPDDSLAYSHAASAVQVLLERGFAAADGVEKELRRQDGLQPDDPKRMSPEEYKRYEDMLTQVETWALTLPEFLRQARVVQHDQNVQKRLWEVFKLVGAREEFLKSLETMRFVMLKGSDKNPESPFAEGMPRELYELAAIATIAWTVREQIQIHPDLLDPSKKADKDVYLRNVELLSDSEVEGGWKATESAVLDQFIIKQSGARYLRRSAESGDKRAEALRLLFSQGRVKVNGTVETDPTRTIATGDSVTVTTVFGRSTERVGAGIDQTRVDVDAQRRVENADRVTQGLPAVTRFAYNPDASIGVWKRLLTASGAKDRQRYARQLGEGVIDFKRDFLERKALDEFLTSAKEQKDRITGKNEQARAWVKAFTWVAGQDVSDTVADRLTTTPGELDRVYQEVSTELTKRFDAFATPERSAVVDELIALLAKAEAGEKIDDARLSELVDAYADTHRDIGDLLVRFQGWQVRENVQRVGGLGPTNNLDLVTRVDNKSAWQYMRQLTPYGAFQTSSYVDPNGRLVLVETGPSFSERGVLGHAWETTKLGLETGVSSAVLAHLLTRVPYLSRIPFFSRLMGSVGVPVILAEGQLALAKEMARQERVALAGKDIEQAAETLEALGKRYAEGKVGKAEVVRVSGMMAQKIRAELTVLLHAATRHEPTDRRTDLLIEAHLYTNQLMTALGFPPMSKLNDGVVPDSVDALKKELADKGFADAKVSPEVERYILSLRGERGMLRAEEMYHTRRELASMRESIDGAKPDKVSMLTEGLMPSSVYLDSQWSKETFRKDMKQARDAMPDAKAKERMGTSERAAVLKSYEVAGSMFDVYRKFGQLNRDLRVELKRNPLATDLQNDWNQEFRMADGKKFTSFQLVSDMNKFLSTYHVGDVIAASKILAANPPSDEEIATYWLKGEYVDNASTRSYLAGIFGSGAGRGAGMSETLLQQWIELQAVHEDQTRHVLPFAHRVINDLDLSRIEKTGDTRLYTLSENDWMVIKTEKAKGKRTGITVQIGRNSGKGDGSYVAGGTFELDGQAYECTPEQRVVSIDEAAIKRDSKVRILGLDGKPLTRLVPLQIEKER